MADEATPLKTTPLTESHYALGGRMVAFAGYSMPVQYRDGILKEHLWTREHASVFDVSHMGPAFLELKERGADPDADHRRLTGLIEPLISGDIARLAPGRLRYTLLLNDEGGILDDLMVGRPPAHEIGRLYIVVNAGTKDDDFARIEEAARDEARLVRADDRALIALQGPEAADVLATLAPAAPDLSFMEFAQAEVAGAGAVISRSGYTGEDGFEILVDRTDAVALLERLLADARVRPAGLGARDSLRLEAGLPLYGHDLDATVSPIEAGLGFAVSKRRLKAGEIRGGERIARELAEGPARVRVGLKVQGAPAREGTTVLSLAGKACGKVTSGGFSPSLSEPIAMAYAPPAVAGEGVGLKVVVREREQPARVTPMPFVPHRYRR